MGWVGARMLAKSRATGAYAVFRRFCGWAALRAGKTLECGALQTLRGLGGLLKNSMRPFHTRCVESPAVWPAAQIRGADCRTNSGRPQKAQGFAEAASRRARPC